MRLARCLTFVVVLAAACGGKDDAAAPATTAAPAEPLIDGKTVSAWCAEIESPATSRAAATVLARIAASEPRALTALVKALSNAEPSVRRAAAESLAGVGEKAVAPVAALLDAEPELTRNAAADSLAGLGMPGLRRLVVALGDPSPRVSASASAALKRAGPLAGDALIDGLQLGNAATRGPAAKCLAALNQTDPLVAALGDASTRDVAADALVSMGPRAVAAVSTATGSAKLHDAASAVLARIRAGNAGETVKALGIATTRVKALADLAAMGDAAQPAIVGGLTGDSDAVRDACVDLLAGRGAACVPDVAPLLADKRSAVRTAAARILLRCGDAGVDPLVAALGGANVDARESVNAAMKDAGAAAAPVLAAALDHGSDAAKESARKSLVAGGASSAPALEELAVRGNSAARATALGALVDLGAPSLPVFRRLLASMDADLRAAAADAVARLGAAAVPTLMSALAAPDPGTFDAAIRGLGRVGAPAVPSVVEALQGSDAAVASRAGEALGAIGAAAIPELAKLLTSPSLATRITAAKALARVAKDADAAVAPLAAALSDADAAVRLEAAWGLASAGPRAKSAAKELEAAMRDRTPAVRIAAATATLRIGGAASSAAMTCINAGLADKDPVVRRLSVDALASSALPNPQLVPQLLTATKDADVHVRLAGIAGLLVVGGKSDDVIEALVRCAKSSDQVERETALAALPKLTDVPMSELLHVGGAFRGDRVKRRQAAALGGTKQTEAAVALALDWFARHQSSSGEWNPKGFAELCMVDRCDGATEYEQNTPGLTGLALLCFLGAGESTVAGPHKQVVAKGLKYLRDIQDSEGCFGPRSSKYFMYNQAAATLAMCEAYMLAGDAESAESARRAAGFVVKAKNPYLAWRYNFPPDGDNDTSVTGWMTYALATARAAGVVEETEAFKDAVAWIEKMTEPEFGRTGYQERGGGSQRFKEEITHFPVDKQEGLTAIGIMVRVFAGHRLKDDELLGKGADLVVKKLPKWDVDAGTIDMYYWFWGTMAMRQIGGDHWKRWGDAMRTALLAGQRPASDGCARGSWDAADPWSIVGSRVYSTAMCCLCLESYWRIDSLLPVETKRK